MTSGKTGRIFTILYRAFYVVLLFGIGTLGFGEQLGIRDLAVRDVIFAALYLFCMLGISYLQLRGRLFCSVLTIVLICMIPAVAGEEHLGGFWSHYGNWLVGGSTWEPMWYAGYKLMQCSVVMVVCYLLQILMERLSVTRDVSAILLLMNLVAVMLRGKNMGHGAVSVTLLYIILCFVEWTQRFWKKVKGNNDKEYILRVFPFLGVYFLLMCCMPAPENPYDWQFVKDAYYNIHERITIWLQEMGRNGQEDFGAAYKGFSEDGKLMSRLVGEDKHLLTVKGTIGLKTNVYLVGKVYDTFDGTQWSQTITEDNRERVMDTLETLYAVKRYDGESMENYVSSTGLDIRYQYFNTGYAFAPLKMQFLHGVDYQYSGSNLIFGEQKGYGTEYKVVYYQLNVDHPQFYQMAETELPEDAEAWKRIVYSYAPEDVEDISLEELNTYRKQEIANFGRKVILSEMVEGYLEDITQNCETKVQKLRAIEKALSGMNYSEHPGTMPETIRSESDFLDYFLMESREGYCSYFATAFVLLARAEGIPARYVEGFCIPVNANKNMIVTSSMAHAWPEVYLEGVGWIPFEPTPGYAQLRYTPWELKDKNSSNSFWEMESEVEDEASIEDIEEEMEPEDSPLVEGEASSFRSRIFIMLLLISLGCIIMLLAERFLFYKRYEKMTVVEQFEVEIKRNRWLLSRLGYTRGEEETIAELQQRIACAFRVLDSLTYYEAYRYGELPITGAILQIVKEERKALLSWLKQKQKWYYYVIVVRLGLR